MNCAHGIPLTLPCQQCSCSTTTLNYTPGTIATNEKDYWKLRAEAAESKLAQMEKERQVCYHCGEHFLYRSSFSTPDDVQKYGKNTKGTRCPYCDDWLQRTRAVDELTSLRQKVLDLAFATLKLCEWVPESSKGSSGQIRKDTARSLATDLANALTPSVKEEEKL